MGLVSVKRTPPARPSVNLTSLMDVLTILLIFLLVNYADQVSDIPNFVSLPLAQIDSGSSGSELPSLSVYVGKERIEIDKEQISIRPWRPYEVGEKLAAHFRKHQDTQTVFLAAHQDVPYYAIDLVIAAAARAGAYKVRFIAKDGRR